MKNARVFDEKAKVFDEKNVGLLIKKRWFSMKKAEGVDENSGGVR